jgi:Ohr subfamily peroxiredoxin
MMKTIYTARTKTTGGRKGHAKSIDGGPIDQNLSIPKAMGGDGGDGANPEQFFGAAYSACFGGAVELVAKQHNVDIGEDFFVEAHVSIGKTEKGDLMLAVILDTYLPKVQDKPTGEKIVNEAHKICPFSHATRDNIDVTLNLLLDK